MIIFFIYFLYNILILLNSTVYRNVYYIMFIYIIYVYYTVHLSYGTRIIFAFFYYFIGLEVRTEQAVSLYTITLIAL